MIRPPPIPNRNIPRFPFTSLVLSGRAERSARTNRGSRMIDYRRLWVALLGAGAVGSQVAALLLKHGDELADRAGAALELVGIAVRDPDAPRETDLPQIGRAHV